MDPAALLHRSPGERGAHSRAGREVPPGHGDRPALAGLLPRRAPQHPLAAGSATPTRSSRSTPSTAKELGIDDGEWVAIENDRGRIRRKAKVTPIVHPQVVSVPHGWWLPETEGREPNLYGIWDLNCNLLSTSGRAMPPATVAAPTRPPSSPFARSPTRRPLGAAGRATRRDRSTRLPPSPRGRLPATRKGCDVSKKGLLVDYAYCTGCHSCEIACKQENQHPPGRWGIKVTEMVFESDGRVSARATCLSRPRTAICAHDGRRRAMCLPASSTVRLGVCRTVRCPSLRKSWRGGRGRPCSSPVEYSSGVVAAG